MQKMVMKKFILVVVLVLLATVIVAHGDESDSSTFEKDYGEILQDRATNAILIASVLCVLLIALSMKINKKLGGVGKGLMFGSFVVVVIGVSFFSAGTTVYLNMISETGGPVHWHADFEVWNCGESVNLKDPTGLSNRLGTPVYHEHGDNRLHVEGVVVNGKDVSLSRFFEVIGGDLHDNELIVPTNNGPVAMKDGEECNGKEGKLQVFVLKVTNAYTTQHTGYVYEQTKLDYFENYVLSPYINVPPGDCIIIEFDEDKEKTDKICETFRISIENGDMTYGS